MTKQELEKWIEKNEGSIKSNTFTRDKCQEEIDFARQIIEEIKKINPDEKEN